MKGSAAALAALLFALVPATAEAGTYEVQLCADPAAPGFAARNDAATVFTVAAACPPVPGEPFTGLSAAVKSGAANASRGTAAGWTLTAPSGTTFESVTARYRLLKHDRDYEITVKNAADRVLDSCGSGVICSEEVTTRTFGRTSGLKFEVRCDEAVCADPKLAMLAIESARATVEDPSAPVIAPAAAPAWQRTPAVTVSAADAGGVASLALKTGERTLGATALACDFRHLQPCPGTGSATFGADLPDGTYPLTAQATDAAGQTATVPYGTLMLDRSAPAAPTGLAVRATGNGRYSYSWTNPDQGQAAPIAAARLSDGTVVRGANIQALESASPVERIHLEDAAGNADPATAVGAPSPTPLQLKPPVLQPTIAAKIKIASAKRQGTRLVVKGTVRNASATRVTAIVTRGKRTARKSATLSKGRFTIRVALSSPLRRKGSVSLTVRHGTAKATKRLRF